MSKVKTTVVVAVLALVLAGTASGSTHKKANWFKMTLTQRLHVVNHEIAVNRPPVRWWIRVRRNRFTESSAAPLHQCAAIGIRAPGEVCVSAQKLVKALHVQRTIQAKLDAIAARKRAAALAASFPPHHALWLCISRYEGSPTSVNPNGHYGMLQMSWDWMGQIKGAASNYPQAVQEWAAERAWAASGYAYSFLYGQWYEWDNADGCGTTG